MDPSSSESREFVVGTSGHIDHGKTALVKALTGVDADRFEEEKQRGITIDLGFAPYEDESGTRLGFVDVPGHEKFVHNMLAGVAGFDAVLLVIAADEGVMPQTREHLNICNLLQIPNGLVALTRIDLVEDAEMIELCRDEIEELVEGNITRFAAIFHSRNVTDIGPVRSARTGDFDLLSNLNSPLFGNSGGNPTVMRLLNEVDMVLVGDTNAGREAYRRYSGRRAPHNLMTGTGEIYAWADGRGGIPPQMFSYRDEEDTLPISAEQVDGIEIDYGGYQVEYRWDDENGGWARQPQGTDLSLIHI